MRKLVIASRYQELMKGVSVPLRGLDMRKPKAEEELTHIEAESFSPLAGIRYAETSSATLIGSVSSGFSPLAGIRYAETQSRRGTGRAT